MADGTTNAATSTTAGSIAAGGPGSGNSNFAQDNNYIPLERDDMAGGQVVDSNLDIVHTSSQLRPNRTQPVLSTSTTLPTSLQHTSTTTSTTSTTHTQTKMQTASSTLTTSASSSETTSHTTHHTTHPKSSPLIFFKKQQ